MVVGVVVVVVVVVVVGGINEQPLDPEVTFLFSLNRIVFRLHSLFFGFT